MKGASSILRSTLTSSDIELFWDKVEKNIEGECWKWQGALDQKGYGQKWCAGIGRCLRAHRMSYAIEYGKVPKGKLVCHHCDNPSCVNPNHLFLGDNSDNIQDAINKGRLNDRHGENNGHDKLSKEEVMKIVDRLKNNEYICDIAKDYDVCDRAISDIKIGKRWSHLTGIEEPIGLPLGTRKTKLTEEDVKEICYRYIKSDEDITQKELAEEYNVHRSTIIRILHNTYWQDVERPTRS